MDYFKNTETRVRRTSTGITELPDGYLSNSVVNVPVSESKKPSMSIIAKTAKQKAELEKKNQEKRNQINKKFANTRLELAAKKAMFDKKYGEMSKKGKKAIFKRLLTEMYIESLYLDESFILENFTTISKIVDDFIEENGGYSLLENAYIKTKSPLLKNMMDICEATTKRVNERLYKLAEKEQNVDLLNFELDADEKERLDYEKRDLGIEEISNIVKEKVLKVVKDEKAREQKNEELKNDIEAELSENPNVVDEKSVKENLARIFAQASPTEEGTLFNALLRNNYKNILEGNSELFTNEFSKADEGLIVDDIDFEDADLEEEITDFEEENEHLEDEEIFEIFDVSAETVVKALQTDEATAEDLEEAFNDMKCKIKSAVKNVKSCKRAKKVRKDLRKIQKSTEELEEAGCKSKATESECKKKSVESFIDALDDCVEDLDAIIDIHESTIIQVAEAMKKTTKGGKTFVQPVIKLNDINLPDIQFMYKVKLVEKEINKLTKSAKNKNVAKNVQKIIDKNISNINAMITKLEKSTKKSIDKKIKSLETLKAKLQTKVSVIKESYEFLEESIFVEENEVIDILEEASGSAVADILAEIKDIIKDFSGVEVHANAFKIYMTNLKLIKASSKITKAPTKQNINEAIKLCDELIALSEKAIKVFNDNRFQLKVTKEFNERNFRTSIDNLKQTKKQLQNAKSVAKESYEIEFEEEEFIEEVAENTIDMDKILAQTIANYTLMEMCYTIKLTDYRTADIKKLSHNLLNK